jgi:hypothetical protein
MPAREYGVPANVAAAVAATAAFAVAVAVATAVIGAGAATIAVAAAATAIPTFSTAVATAAIAFSSAATAATSTAAAATTTAAAAAAEPAQPAVVRVLQRLQHRGQWHLRRRPARLEQQSLRGGPRLHRLRRADASVAAAAAAHTLASAPAAARTSEPAGRAVSATLATSAAFAASGEAEPHRAGKLPERHCRAAEAAGSHGADQRNNLVEVSRTRRQQWRRRRRPGGQLQYDGTPFEPRDAHYARHTHHAVRGALQAGARPASRGNELQPQGVH